MPLSLCTGFKSNDFLILYRNEVTKHKLPRKYCWEAHSCEKSQQANITVEIMDLTNQ